MNELFLQPQFPLALALIMGGMKQPSPSRLPAMMMAGLNQSQQLAENQQRMKAMEELSKSSGPAFANALGLPENEAVKLIRTLGSAPGAAAPLLSLMAQAPQREMQQLQTMLAMQKSRQEMEERRQAQAFMERLLGGGGQVPGGAGQQPVSVGGAAQLDPRMALVGLSMPGLSQGQRDMLKEMLSQSNRETQQPFANDFNREAFAILGRMPRTQDEFQRVLGAIEQKKREERGAMAGIAASAAAAATSAARQAEPLSASDLTHYIDKYGNTPAPGSTARDVRGGGYRAVTAGVAGQIPNIKGTYAYLNQLEDLSSQILTKEGIGERLAQMPELLYQQYAQTDQPIAQFEAIRRGGLSRAIRALGEVGTLSEGDVKRAEALMPKLYPVPDTPEVARRKIEQIREIVRAGSGIEPEPRKKSTAPLSPAERQRLEELRRKRGAQ